MSFICSRCVRRDKQIGGNVVYLFAVGLPRQATRRKSRLSIRGELAVTSKPPKKSFIYSRRACRDKQTAQKTAYLLTVSALRQENTKNRRSTMKEWLSFRYRS